MINGLPQNIADKIMPEPNSGCWLWTGADSGGYGVVNIGRKVTRVTRFMLEFTSGKPLGHLWALHRCHVPCCCNPDHLYAGTRSRNTLDAIEHGTHNFTRDPRLRSAGRHKRKLAVDQVLRIRERRAAGERQADLAREYGVTQNAIHWIVARKNWRHV